MIKKRKYNKNKSSKQTDRARVKSKNPEYFEKLHSVILCHLYTAETETGLSEIENTLQNETFSRKMISQALDDLFRQGYVSKDRKNKYQLTKRSALYEGILTQNPKGFGFVSHCRAKDGSSNLERDPFVSQGKMAGAHHGDRVLIRVLRVRNDKRPEAVVVSILTHASDEIFGTYTRQGKKSRVYPDDPGFPFTVTVVPPGDLQPAEGDVVKVKIFRESLTNRELSGKILEVVGNPECVDTQIRLVSQKFDLPSAFPAECLLESEHINAEITPGGNREDLRQIRHVTIDGETAKDFDDAVCVEKGRKGYRLYVSIADVSHYVTPGSAIDREAYARGTSTYFPGRVIPMLPERLSNNLCSLVPEMDRYTVTAILDYDREGRLLDTRFCRSVINSRQRFTYTTVASILEDKDPATRKSYKPFLTELKWMQELAEQLIARKNKRGAIDFNLPETEFNLSEEGTVIDLEISKRNLAHRIIEEFMLAANEAVAALFDQHKLNGMFRVHERPDALKAEEFYKFAQTLGLHLPPLKNTPPWYCSVIEKCASTKHEYIINNLILRTMQQAQYSADNQGHFGLSLQNYTHFTSPIRRYPDLIVHRVLLHFIDRKNPGDTRSHAEMQKKGVHLSARERAAMNAEREIAERLKIHFMKHKIGENFRAIISGVCDSCLFVELPDFGVSGSVDVMHLDDDYYLFDAKNHRLFGEISGKTYQIGDSIEVTLIDVDAPRRRINFKVTETAG